MQYLSKEIEALAKKKRQTGSSLVKNEHSCGIFQDYGTGISPTKGEEKDKSTNF